MLHPAVATLFFTELAFAGIFNSLGLYLLFKDRNSNHTNQNLILKCLSTCELAAACSLMISTLLENYILKANHYMVRVTVRIVYYTYMNYMFIMMIMTLDRLIATKYPITYASMMTRKKAQFILFASAMLCIIVGICFWFVEYNKFLFIFDTYIFPIAASISAAFIIMTYIYIFIKISRKRNSDNSTQMRSTRENRQFLKMAAIITLSYSICFLLTDLTYALCSGCFDSSTTKILYALYYLGLICDPVTYILMQKRLRKSLTAVKGCGKKQNDNSQGDISMVTAKRSSLFDTRL